MLFGFWDVAVVVLHVVVEEKFDLGDDWSREGVLLHDLLDEHLFFVMILLRYQLVDLVCHHLGY
jgi:hypothetical protein